MCITTFKRLREPIRLEMNNFNFKYWNQFGYTGQTRCYRKKVYWNVQILTNHFSRSSLRRLLLVRGQGNKRLSVCVCGEETLGVTL